jgi:4-amino-4-deoxy-L-arabinose transferase-like glycosyltransferase
MSKINDILQSINRLWLSTGIFLISIIIIVIFLKLLPASVKIVGSDPDFVGNYAPAARNLLAGRGFILDDGTPALHYPPGYSLIIAGIFKLSDYFGVDYKILMHVFNVLVSSLVAVIIFLLAAEIWGPAPGIIVSLIWITYPFNLWFNCLASTEIPFMVFFLGSIYIIISAGLRDTLSGPICFLAGILMGAAMLIRPMAIGMSFIIGVIIWLLTSNIKSHLKLFLIIMVFAGNLLVVAPWEGWMYQRSGKIIPLCASGINAIRDGLTFAVKMKGYRQGVWVPAGVRTLQEDISGQYNKLKTLGDVASVMAEKLRTQPAAVVKLFFIKLSRSWYGTDSQKFEMPILLIQGLYLMLILWGTRVIWKMGRTAKKLVLGVWLIVFYSWGMCIISLTLLRYMVPIMGLLFLFLPPVFKPGLRKYQLPIQSAASLRIHSYKPVTRK